MNEKLTNLLTNYFDGFRTQFDADIFHEDYHFYGPVVSELHGSRNKHDFLQEMQSFSKEYPLDESQGDNGISILAQSDMLEENKVLVFYVMHFQSGLNLDVGDLLTIKNNQIIEARAIFDPRAFL